NNCATVTGRLSGSRPNMQNIPRDGTSKVKQMFESRFGKEGRIVEVDYSALEVVALASISGDKNLLQQLIDGTDMHCYRLAGALGEDYATVFEKCHDKSHPEHKKYKQLRTDIKPRAFANQYGASAMGISFS
ncbi:DNA polymerase, partial [Salmonella sp. s40490]